MSSTSLALALLAVRTRRGGHYRGWKGYTTKALRRNSRVKNQMRAASRKRNR